MSSLSAATAILAFSPSARAWLPQPHATPDAVLLPGSIDDIRAIYETLRDLGGKRYSASGVPFSPADWRDHFGAAWPTFAQLKHRFDPRRILTPGPSIFA